MAAESQKRGSASLPGLFSNKALTNERPAIILKIACNLPLHKQLEGGEESAGTGCKIQDNQLRAGWGKTRI